MIYYSLPSLLKMTLHKVKNLACYRQENYIFVNNTIFYSNNIINNYKQFHNYMLEVQHVLYFLQDDPKKLTLL